LQIFSLHRVKKRLNQLWQTVRPVLTGWLVVALLLPMLLALTPAGASAAVADDVARICTSLGDNPAPDHNNHLQDCPCCLPSGQAAMALPLRGTFVLPVPLRREVAASLASLTQVISAPIDSSAFHARGPPIS